MRALLMSNEQFTLLEGVSIRFSMDEQIALAIFRSNREDVTLEFERDIFQNLKEYLKNCTVNNAPLFLEFMDDKPYSRIVNGWWGSYKSD